MRVATLLLLSLFPAALFGQAERDPKGAAEVGRQMDSHWGRQSSASERTDLRSEKLVAAVAAFEQDPSKFTAPYLVAGGFSTVDGKTFLALHVSLPSSVDLAAGARCALFGELKDAAGQRRTFEIPVTLDRSGSERYVESSMPLPAGKWSGVAGLARSGNPAVLGAFSLEVPPFDKDAEGLSDLIVSADVHPLSAAQVPMEPFAFGGLKVLPKGDRRLQRNGENWAFAELRNPVLDETGKPRIQARIELVADDGGKRRVTAPTGDVEAAPLAGMPRRYGVGLPLQFGSLPPGGYTMQVTVVDRLSSARYELTEKIVIE